MPVVFTPFPFIFVAGGYDSSMAEAFFAAGLLKIIERARAKLLATTEAEAVLRNDGTELLPLGRLGHSPGRVSVRN